MHLLQPLAPQVRSGRWQQTDRWPAPSRYNWLERNDSAKTGSVKQRRDSGQYTQLHFYPKWADAKLHTYRKGGIQIQNSSSEFAYWADYDSVLASSNVSRTANPGWRGDHAVIARSTQRIRAESIVGFGPFLIQIGT